MKCRCKRQEVRDFFLNRSSARSYYSLKNEKIRMFDNKQRTLAPLTLQKFKIVSSFSSHFLVNK